MRLVVVVATIGLVASAAVFPQTEVQPQVVPLQPSAEAPSEGSADTGSAAATADPAAAIAAPTVAASPGPVIDWATGAELPQAPKEVAPMPSVWQGDDRIQGAADSNCVSIMPGTSDWWCATTCASRSDAASCPPTMCKCDDKAKADADARAASAIASHKDAEDAVKAVTAGTANPNGLPSSSPAAEVAQEKALVSTQEDTPAEKPPSFQQEDDSKRLSHDEAENVVKAAADAAKAAADEAKSLMLPGASPQPEPSIRCTAILETASDEWCDTTCATSYCPPTACKCEKMSKLKSLTTENATDAAATPADATDPAAATVDVSSAADNKPIPEASPASPGVDWATGQPLPKAPTAIPEPAYQAPVVPAVPETPATPDTAPLPTVWQGDDRVQSAADSNCVSIMPGTSDWWCATTCASRPDEASCPPTMCKCDDSAKADAVERAAEAIATQKAAEDAVKAAVPGRAYPDGLPAVAASPIADPTQGQAETSREEQATTPELSSPQEQALPPAQEQESDVIANHKAAEDAVKDAADEAAALTPEASPAPAETKCKAILDTATDEWCTTTCASSYCPPTACKCDK